MCKQKDKVFCSALGNDPASWSRQTLLARPSWYLDAWEQFKATLFHEQAGNFSKAVDALPIKEGFLLQNWYHEHAQNSGVWRAKTFGVQAKSSASKPDSLKLFNSLLLQVLSRDNFRCRYCSVTVIPRKRLKRMKRTLGAENFSIGRRNLDCNGFYLVTSASLDHVIPHSFGGATTVDNLVASCLPCNYGKSSYSLEQIGIDNPFERIPLPMELPLSILTGESS